VLKFYDITVCLCTRGQCWEQYDSLFVYTWAVLRAIRQSVCVHVGSVESNTLKTLSFLLFSAVYMLLINRITKCVVWSFYWAADIISATEDISQLYLGMALFITARHWPSIQSQMITVHTILYYSCKVNFNNIYDCSLPFSLPHQNSLCISRLGHPAAVVLTALIMWYCSSVLKYSSLPVCKAVSLGD
jgi:hypothetical protein